jgi:hypothetical protein
MYNCKQCGNKKYFYEHNEIRTHIILDDENKEHTIVNSYDEFLSCVEVCCERCNASTEDDDIVDDDGNPIEIERLKEV